MEARKASQQAERLRVDLTRMERERTGLVQKHAMERATSAAKHDEILKHAEKLVHWCLISSLFPQI